MPEISSLGVNSPGAPSFSYKAALSVSVVSSLAFGVIAVLASKKLLLNGAYAI